MSDLKIEGKVGDFCPNCKNCKAVTRMHDGETASIRLTEVECEDPYDGMAKTLDADSDICCSMFEPNSPCDKISLLQHELEMDRLRRTIHELEKEKAAHMKGIERLKKSNEKFQNQVKNLQNIVTEKEVEIKYLRKDNARLNKDISWGNMIAEKNTELNQTISDQEVTIKALLITIKEMCKEDETNE